MKKLLLFSSISLASGLLFTNLYTSLVDAKSWGAAIPESMGVARQYYRTVNPGNFFRIFSPLNQGLALGALILFWRSSPRTRLYLGATLLLYVGADAFTFAYFYPRNEVMFQSAALTDTARLTQAWSEWTTMNWLRGSLLLAGIGFSGRALHRVYSAENQPAARAAREPAASSAASRERLDAGFATER